MARAEFSSDPGARTKTPRRKPTKRPTRRRLHNIAVYYLKRFSTTAAGLRRMLQRRVLKMTLDTPELRQAAQPDIDAVVEALVTSGAVDDTRYAEAAAHLGRVLKKPRAKTAAKLRAKGVDTITIRHALGDPTDDDGDFEAGLAIAKRRRLGPFRKTERSRETDHKDLGALARAGLSFATAKRVIAWSER